jgi:IS30 family transposase
MELDKRGTIPGMISIEQRLAEVADRSVPGHWEGDSILGKDHKSA